MRPRKRFGQHFLEPAWVGQAGGRDRPAPDDRFLEIGPGRGAHHSPARRAGRATASRSRSIAIWRPRSRPARAAERQGVTADVLDVDLGRDRRAGTGRDPCRRVRVVGNLPYNISSPILFRLLDAPPRPASLQDATLMLQKEVADRLVGVARHGRLRRADAVNGSRRGRDPAARRCRPARFVPRRKVHSAVVRLAFRPPPPEVADPAAGRRHRAGGLHAAPQDAVERAGAVCVGARHCRSQDALAAAGIDPRRRPETLELAEVARLADVFAALTRNLAVL